MTRKFLLLFLSTFALGNAMTLTERLVLGWMPDFDDRLARASASELVLIRQAVAARQGRFQDAHRLLREASANTDLRTSLLTLLQTRFTLNIQYSLIGGAVGAQPLLSVERSAAGPSESQMIRSAGSLIGRMPPVDQSDASMATNWHMLLDSCRGWIPAMSRVRLDRQAMSPEMADTCLSQLEPVNPLILDSTVKLLMQKTVTGDLESGHGNIEGARHAYLEGLNIAKKEKFQRSAVEFALRLGDLAAIPNGHWMTLGYNLASEDNVRIRLLSGASLPVERRAPPPTALAEAEQWYTTARRLAQPSPAGDVLAGLEFRTAALAYLRGNAAEAARHFSSAAETASQAGWARLSSIAAGLSALLALDQARFTHALLEFANNQDAGGHSSLTEIAASYAAILQYRGESARALKVWTMIVKAVAVSGNRPITGEISSTIASRMKAQGETDLALYWARRAVSDQERIIEAAAPLANAEEFLPSMRERLSVLLLGIVTELYYREVTEPSEHWTRQRTAVEARMLSLASPDVAARLTSDYLRSKDRMSKHTAMALRVRRIASCQFEQYDALRAQVDGERDPALSADLDLALVRCGDQTATERARTRLKGLNVTAMIAALRANAPQDTPDVQRDFAAANLSLITAIELAIRLEDFETARRWLAAVEGVVGPSLSVTLARLVILAGSRQPQQLLELTCRIIIDPTFAMFDGRSRMTVVSALAEAYAQLGRSRDSLGAALWTFREHEASATNAASPRAREIFRRAALLRAEPGTLSAGEQAELDRLCLNLGDQAQQTAITDISPLLDRIPRGTVVLAFFRGHHPWVWRLERGREPVLKEIVAGPELAVGLQRFRADVVAGSGQTAWRTRSELLYDRLIRPVGPIAPGQVLVIAGAGQFEGIPFEALGPAGGRLLGQTNPVTQVEDMIANKPRISFAKPARSLFIGVDDGTLPNAEAEAEELAALNGGTPLSGLEATRSRVLEAVGRANWVHFATHGSVDPINPFQSSLALSGGSRLLGQDLLLTATSASMMTFSACETNVAPAPIGLAPRAGFARGLTLFAHAAGAHWVVSTSWKVKDLPARAIMNHYYHQVLSGIHPAIALYRAKQKYIAAAPNDDPSSWLAFTLSAATLRDAAPER